MIRVIKEFISYDKRLTCKMFLDEDHSVYLSSVDLDGEDIAGKIFKFEGETIRTQRLAHFMSIEFLHGAMKVYEALMTKGFKEAE